MNFKELEGLWKELLEKGSPDLLKIVEFKTKSIGEIEENKLFLAVDKKKKSNLLIQVPNSYEIEEDSSTKAVDISEKSLYSEGTKEINKYILIHCSNYRSIRDFLYYIEAIFENSNSFTEKDINQLCVYTLNSFKDTFAPKRKKIASKEKLIGLFGELYILMQILEKKQSLFDTWKGPEGYQWDFLNNKIAFEVKTAIKTGKKRTCEIHGKEQLEIPVDGELFLIYIPIVKSTISGLSIKDLFDRILKVVDINTFLDLLSEEFFIDIENEKTYKEIAGYSINENDLQIYKIHSEFPRIVSENLKINEHIGYVNYLLDLNDIPIDYKNISSFNKEIEKYINESGESE